MLQQFLQLRLSIDCSASKHNRHWKQQMQRDKQHASTTPSTVRVAFPIEIVYLHLPQPASTTALTTAYRPPNTIHAATISTTAISWVLFFNWFFNHQAQQRNSFHSSCCHDFGNCHWLLIFQLTYTTGIENSKCNEIHNCIDYTLFILCCIFHYH